MMHAKRHWCLAPVESPEALAQMLTDRTWTLCSAFCIAGREEYIFLNDATHEDGALEMAVVKRLPDGRCLQVESITFSWCDAAKAKKHIEDALAGSFDGSDFVREVHPQIESRDQHRHCHNCA